MGSGELRTGTYQALWEGGRRSLMSQVIRLLDDAMSRSRNCPVGNVSREWLVGATDVRRGREGNSR